MRVTEQFKRVSSYYIMKRSDLVIGHYYLIKLSRTNGQRATFLHGCFIEENQDSSSSPCNTLRFLIRRQCNSNSEHAFVSCYYVSYIFAKEIVKCLGSDQQNYDYYLRYRR